MVFSDLFFLFAFLPAFALCYLVAMCADRYVGQKNGAVNPHRFSNIAIVIFSLFFYAWGEPVYVLLMLLSVVVNYFFGIQIDARQSQSRKYCLALGVSFNLLVLVIFKYLSFFVSQLIGCGIPVASVSIALPIGISFYTFQSISYLVDVYRKEAMPQHRFADLLLYISMFPQLIAGPIVRYGSVANEITHRSVSAHDLSEGMMRFFRGLGKKVILANQLSVISSQLLAASQLDDLTMMGAWIGICAFTLQIYFDFSGYSDMAIGIGRCLGFHFCENFDHPYCCRSITEFWRRWHMSLGSFFRDYVYIPLGGNRRHRVFNILCVWMLTGFWHGASWNFLLWGLYFGLIIMAEKHLLIPYIERIPRVLLHLYSMLLVVAGWGLFYFDDFDGMLRFFHVFCGMDGITTDFASENTFFMHGWLWIVALLFCLPIRQWVERYTLSHPVLQTGAIIIRFVWAFLLVAVSVSLLVGATNNAFLYTRF